ncbi:hypothetical protein CDOO_08985 [Corynebacterium doosanense CAU 212 = DSM 45436]|uniref:DUF2975 domain-containing protein n=1 Tax=Corynebacterium doosanense CAU 212 = DSM 45436 TaxID=558173 RepID=A0A097IJH1_9CORY|nr:hypothetical protein CDOO_08985 [Corynebacterium doosanense CAU 212 = DSM 45436]
MVALGIAVSWIGIDIFRTFSTRGFEAALAPALDPSLGGGGRVPFDVLDSGPFGYYLTGYILCILGLLMATLFLLTAAQSYSRSGQLGRRIGLLLTGASAGIMVWAVGKFITHMGNNFAANRLGVLDRWEGMNMLDMQTMILMSMFFATLSFLSMVSARTLTLQEEQEGLV